MGSIVLEAWQTQLQESLDALTLRVSTLEQVVTTLACPSSTWSKVRAELLVDTVNKDVAMDLVSVAKAQINSTDDTQERMHQQLRNDRDTAASRQQCIAAVNQHSATSDCFGGRRIFDVDSVVPERHVSSERGEPSILQGSERLSDVIENHADAPHANRSTRLSDADLEQECQTTVEGSAWNVVLVMGFPGIPLGESIIASFLYLLNMFVQGSLCFIVGQAFKPDVVDVEEVEAWRWSVGHNARFSDNHGRSLIHRMCEELTMVEMSSELKDNLKRDTLYLQRLPVVDLPIGPSLTCLCLLMWFLLLWEETESTIRLLRGLFRRPRAHDTQLCHTTAGNLKICTTSVHRCCASTLSMIPRLAIVSFLACNGTTWLIHTRDLEDLLLNCTALEFILTVDEVLFVAMSPLRFKSVMTQLEPLTYKEPTNGCHIRPLLIFQFVMACLLFVYFVFLIPGMREAEALVEAMCGGKTDFSVADQLKTGLAVALVGAYSDNANEPLSIRTARYLAKGGEQQEYLSASSAAHMAFLESMALPSYVDTFGRCVDLEDGAEKLAILAALRHAVNNYSLASCSDLPADACSRDDVIIRIACPLRCGCSQPLTGEYLVDGCAFHRCAERWGWQAAHAILSTKDPHAAVLQALPAWHQYWHGFEVVMATGKFERNPFFFSAEQAKQIASVFRSSGCRAMAILSASAFARASDTFVEFLCSEKLPGRRPLRPFCPEACHCADSQQDDNNFCPKG